MEVTVNTVDTTDSGLSPSGAPRQTWFEANRTFLVVFVAILLLTLVPLYRVLFPPLNDLPLHVLVSKLLYEKLTGTSNLDLQISWYIGYRLTSYLIAIVIGTFKLFGISLVYLPKMVVGMLVAIHTLVVVPILYHGLRSRDWASAGMTICYSLPAVVCIYSACFFNGFVGYTLAITILVAAVFFTEKWLENGEKRDALLLFASLVLVYTAHPFALVFWLFWCVARAIVSIPMWTIKAEWKRLPVLGAAILPIVAYHLLATFEEGAPSLTEKLKTVTPFVTYEFWANDRFHDFLIGNYVKADLLSVGLPFSLLTVFLIVSSIFFAFWSGQNRTVKAAAFANPLFLLLASLPNEQFFPVPGGHWLAYNWRFNSTVFTLCLAVASAVLIRSLPVARKSLVYSFALIVVAMSSLGVSINHISEVYKAWGRFDPPARVFMEQILDRRRPTGVTFVTGGSWFPGDGQFLRHYQCLQEPDCNPAGSGLAINGGIVYPVIVRSPKRIFPKKPYPLGRTGNPGNALTGGEGYWGGQFSRPRGVATDLSGNIYVADTGNSRVEKFDPEGNFVDDFGTYGDNEGEFRSPQGIAVDDKGSIYVSDTFGRKLMRFSPDGRFEKEWKGATTTLNVPSDISIGPNNDLYIADQDKIVRFDPVADKFSSWGSPGSGEGQFIKLSGIGTGGEIVVAADSGNNRIQIFDLDGKFIRQFEVSAWAKYVWHYPDAVYDPTLDLIYVTSGWSREVLTFDTKGQLLTKLEKPPGAELNNPSSAALSIVNGQKRLYVVSVGSDIVMNGQPGVSMFDLTK